MHRLIPTILLFAGLLLGPGVARVHAQPDDGSPIFSFGVVADVQYCDCPPRGSRHYRASLEKLAEAVQAFNRAAPAFVVQLGDLIDRDAASFEAVLPLMRRIEAPVHHILGNHEFSVDGALGADVRSGVLEVLGQDRAYYDFRHGGWRFIVLDGNDVSLHGTMEGSEARRQAEGMLERLRRQEAVHAERWNGGLGAAQLSWLDRTLAAADAAGERVVLFSHYPVYPEDAHNLWNSEAVLDILEAHPSVVAYLSGHNHAGGYAVRGGVHFLTLHGMVETPGSTAYAFVDVMPEGLRVRGAGREPDRFFQVGTPKR